MILVDGDDNEGEVDAASLIVAKSIKADMNTQGIQCTRRGLLTPPN